MVVTETFANLPSTTVSSGGTDAPSGGTSQSWTVAASTSFPAAATGVTQFHISDPVQPSEIIAVTNVSGTTWTVTRGAESTTPVAHTAGFTVKQVVTAGFLTGLSPQNYAGVFGAGSDGAVTFDGTTTVLGLVPSTSVYTMTRDIFCTAITVNNGVTLKTGNFRIFCQGTVTTNGTISNAGNAASGATPGGVAGSAAAYAGGRAGGAGGSGSSGAGAAGGVAVFGTPGGAGGAGVSGAAGAGGTTSITNATASAGIFPTPFAALLGVAGYAFASNLLGTGAGGGGGGSDSSSNAGGGGGGGGGIVAIFAWAVNNGGGTISVAGGAGGNAVGGNAGGGGGGSGGLILVYTLTAWTAGTTNVTGGALGTKLGSGTNGNTGGAGLVLNVVLQ